MSLNPDPASRLHDALRPHRADPEQFEAAVRARVLLLEAERTVPPSVAFSPWLKSAAAFLPLPLVAGCRVSGASARSIPSAGGFKLMGYVTFPAISLFVLLGATVLSASEIRGTVGEDHPALGDARAMDDAMRLWWDRHRWPAWLVFGVTIALMILGATWMLFLFYILSFGILAAVFSSLARLGVGNRRVIGQQCMMGLTLLGQLACSFSYGGNDIHFMDQAVIGVLFFGGGISIFALSQRGGPTGAVGWRQSGVGRRVLMLAVVIPLSAWLLGPTLRPIGAARIKGYVESFDEAPFGSSSWQQWEIVARWAIEARLDPDLAGARRLLARELAERPDPYTLGSAFRVGLIPVEQIGLLKEYKARRKSLLDDPYQVQASLGIPSLTQEDWVIRASVLNGTLTDRERDYLAHRLHLTMDALATSPYDVIPEALRITQLLAVIGRPFDPARYRAEVHDLLRKFHSQQGGGFQLAGGFKRYLNSLTGDATATEYAIELMDFYGVPAGLDINWVRSYLRPSFLGGSDKWIVAVARQRLAHLPGVAPPTWLETLYHERSFLAALVLVGLCLYATLAAPRGD